ICELAKLKHTELEPWQNVFPGNVITLQGTYAKDGLLKDCRLVETIPAADARLKGKQVEVSGTGGRVVLPSGGTECPTVLLEGETHTKLDIVCLFTKDVEEAVKKILPGQSVTIRGACGGREQGGKDQLLVRIDNCKVVYTTAPDGGLPRYPARELA